VPNDSLAWAGFSNIGGLEVAASHEETGQDKLVQFVLRGSSVDIDKALAAANFTSPPTAGVNVYQPPLPDFDPKTLTSPQSGKDQWKNTSGQTVNRLYVRGGTPSGAQVLQVWAFTT